MLWFQGAIPAAIASAKRSGAVFVVFVAGDDEQSTQMAASWEDEKVTEASSNSFVAIKIDTKSEACLQFSQIYPVVCVPSSFFIGDSGIPLEVIAGSVSADELVMRIHKVRQMHSLKGETSVANSSQSENSVSAPSASFEPNNTSENSQSRNVELCETLSTSDAKSDTAAGGESSGRATPSQEPSGCSNQRPAEDLTVRVESTVARIQFRLPDGSSFTNQFPSDAPLEEARQFAAQTVGNTYGNFSLATMFPRREFTKEDYKKKLLDLELAPSASVVLLPAGRPTSSIVHSSSGDIWTLLGTVLYPFLAIWRLISNFLFSNPPAQTSVRTSLTETSNPASSSKSEKREPVRKRVLEKRGEDFKKEGKIYRLRTQDDGEDDNNTWNGNSTQQM
uniref:UBX domain-containing protein 4 n=1 Tax=Oryctolagus cuniculus TaxID=9986 RepID=A0A5F9CPR9_RABIT